MGRVVVVIPIYSERLKPSERVSLTQAKSVLKEYDLCYMMPEKLRHVVSDENIKKEFWRDECFNSPSTYSKLLLTPEFYQRFFEYEYMLIYQLDAFVFSDQLQKFCDLGYDYIGAPIPYWVTGRSQIHAHVGNGGLSLRRVRSCHRVTSDKTDVYADTGHECEFENYEDMFFGFCGWSSKISFRVPNMGLALKFSIEYDVRKCWGKLASDNLPFGCHGWSRPHQFDLWYPFIKYFAGDMEDVIVEINARRGKSYQELRQSALHEYLLRRLFRQQNVSAKLFISRKIMPADRCYILWGNGKTGQKARELVSFFGGSIEAIIDTIPKDNKTHDGVPVLRPDYRLLLKRQNFIVVAVTKKAYVKEIIAHLEILGLKNNEDFLCYSDMVKKVITAYRSFICDQQTLFSNGE